MAKYKNKPFYTTGFEDQVVICIFGSLISDGDMVTAMAQFTTTKEADELNSMVDIIDYMLEAGNLPHINNIAKMDSLSKGDPVWSADYLISDPHDKTYAVHFYLGDNKEMLNFLEHKRRTEGWVDSPDHIITLLEAAN